MGLHRTAVLLRFEPGERGARSHPFEGLVSMRGLAAGSRTAARICRFCRPVEMSVETGFVDDGTNTGQRLVAPLWDGLAEHEHRAGVGARQSQQDSDQGRLAGTVRAEVAERAPPGTSRSTPLTATLSPNRLTSPCVSTAHRVASV